MDNIAGFCEISPFDLEASNAFRAVGKELFLICAEHDGVTNAMTAGWGFLGYVWRRPAVMCLVRPQRFTYTLTEKADRFSLCFFGGEMMKELSFFGTASGRDTDKAAATGTEYRNAYGVPYLAQAHTVLICRKMYAGEIRPGEFTDDSVRDACYPGRDWHRTYIGEVEHCLIRE